MWYPCIPNSKVNKKIQWVNPPIDYNMIELTRFICWIYQMNKLEELRILSVKFKKQVLYY